MITIDLLVMLLIALGLVVFVADPLVRGTASGTQTSAAGQEIERLALQKETLYTAILDLDFDFQTAKVEQNDYTALRQQLEREAVHVLQQIDAVDPLAELDSAIERRIAALRQQPLPLAVPVTTCQHCGTELQGDERFCPACGQSLTSQEGH
jgi:hypothetical protein